MPANFEYDAFVSYSHAVDHKLAPSVQSALQLFGKKWYARRALRVFLDETGLSATPELWSDIERALSKSRYFVLIASPEAAMSRWAQREVAWWIENRSSKTMLIVLTGGELRWDPVAGDVDWRVTTALPLLLQGKLPQEAGYVDLRWARIEEHLTVRDPRFRAAVVDLAAPIHDKPKDELDAEDLRQHRIFKAVAKTAVTALALLTIFSGVSAYKAIQNARRAEQQRDLAVGRLTLSYWDASRTAKRDGRHLAALHWAAEALQLQPPRAMTEAILLDMDELTPPASPAALLEHEKISHAVFNGRGDRILTWGGDTARLWRTGEETVQFSLAHPRISGARFSPDDRTLLTWGEDRYVRMWDANTGALKFELRHEEDPTGAVFSPDGGQVLSWTNRSVDLWVVARGAPVCSDFANELSPVGAAFSPDGRRIVSWGYPSASVWDAETCKQIGRSIVMDDFVMGARFDPAGTKLVTWTREGSTADLWDVETGRRIGVPLQHEWPVFGAAFSKSSHEVLTWSLDDTARLWDARTGAPGHVLRHGSTEDSKGVFGAVFNDAGTQILTRGMEGAHAWDASTGEELALLNDGEGVSGAIYSPDGTRILTWTATDVYVWTARSFHRVGVPLAHDRTVGGVVFHRDGSRLLTSDAGAARLWELQPLNEERTFPHGKVLDTKGGVLSPDERSVLTWGKDHAARIWDAESGRLKAVLDHSQIEGAAFSPDGNRILSWGYKRALLWSAKTTAPIGEPLEHAEAAVVAGTFSPDGARIVTWSEAGIGHVWDGHTGKGIGRALQHESSVTGATFNRDATKILTWSEDQSARLWSASSGSPLTPPLRHQHFVVGAALSPDERRILTWSQDGTAAVWDASTGARIGLPLRHATQVQEPKRVTYAAWSRDGRTIVTAGDNGQTKLWDAANGSQMGPALAHVPNADSGGKPGAVFDENERHLLTWSHDNTARIWDVSTRRQTIPPLAHFDVRGAAFVGGGRRVLTWGGNGVTIWDAATGRQLGPLLPSGCDGAVFNRDETRLLRRCGEVYLTQLTADLRFPADQMRVRAAALTGTELDPTTGEIRMLDPRAWHATRAAYRAALAGESPPHPK